MQSVYKVGVTMFGVGAGLVVASAATACSVTSLTLQMMFQRYVTDVNQSRPAFRGYDLSDMPSSREHFHLLPDLETDFRNLNERHCGSVKSEVGWRMEPKWHKDGGYSLKVSPPRPGAENTVSFTFPERGLLCATVFKRIGDKDVFSESNRPQWTYHIGSFTVTFGRQF